MQLARVLVPWLVKISVCKSVVTVVAAANKLLAIVAISRNKMEDLVVELEVYVRIKAQKFNSNVMRYSVSSVSTVWP